MASQATIKCSKCGAKKGTTNTRLKKLIKEAGGKRKLLAGYVCRSCKSGVTRPGKAKAKTKKVKKAKTKKTVKPVKSKLVCSKCGRRLGTTTTRMNKLIGKFGSLEEVYANYVCIVCRKEFNIDNRGRMKPEKRKYKKRNKTVEGEPYVLPEHMRWNQNDGYTGKWYNIKTPAGLSRGEFTGVIKLAMKRLEKKRKTG